MCFRSREKCAGRQAHKGSGKLDGGGSQSELQSAHTRRSGKDEMDWMKTGTSAFHYIIPSSASECWRDPYER